MSDPFLGQIMQVGWGYVNTGWANCNGALLAVSQNSALFSLLGVTFGGNGSTTFGLPDVQGRVLIGQGQGGGLSPYVWGQKSGSESTTLTQGQMPMHTHVATFTPTGGGAVTVQALTGVPLGSVTTTPSDGAQLSNTYPTGPNQPKIYAPAGSGTAVNLGGVSGGLTGGSVTNAMAGGSQPFSNLQPYLAVWTLIAMQGVYPSRQ